MRRTRSRVERALVLAPHGAHSRRFLQEDCGVTVCELLAMLAGRESCEPILDQRLEELESMIRDHDVASFVSRGALGQHEVIESILCSKPTCAVIARQHGCGDN